MGRARVSASAAGITAIERYRQVVGSEIPIAAGSHLPTVYQNKPAVRRLTAICSALNGCAILNFHLIDFGENHDRRDRESLYDRRHAKVRCRKSGLAVLPEVELR